MKVEKIEMRFTEYSFVFENEFMYVSIYVYKYVCLQCLRKLVKRILIIHTRSKFAYLPHFNYVYFGSISRACTNLICAQKHS